MQPTLESLLADLQAGRDLPNPIPTWGPPPVRRGIVQAVGTSGYFLSWDTRQEPHRYLVIWTGYHADATLSEFWPSMIQTPEQEQALLGPPLNTEQELALARDAEEVVKHLRFSATVEALIAYEELPEGIDGPIQPSFEGTPVYDLCPGDLTDPPSLDAARNTGLYYSLYAGLRPIGHVFAHEGRKVGGVHLGPLSAALSVAFAVIKARDTADGTHKLDRVRFLRWAGTPAEALWVPGDFVLIAWAPENNPTFRALETLPESEFLRRLTAPTGR